MIQQNKIPYGVSSFKNFLRQQFGLVLIKQDQEFATQMFMTCHYFHNNFCNKQQWIIIARNFTGQKVQLFKHAKEMYFKRLRLQYNQHSSIITEILHIKFPNLRQLVLVCNNIYSIQNLAFLQAYNLEMLNLGLNDIINISPLKKMQLKKLTRLWLHQNKINQLEPFNRLNVGQPLSDFTIDRNYTASSVGIVKLTSLMKKKQSLRYNISGYCDVKSHTGRFLRKILEE